MDYDDYIDSASWGSRRSRYWQTHSRACAACGSEDDVELHHLEYDPQQRGVEPDHVLLPLCAAHHAEVHALHDANSDMLTLRQATASVVTAYGGQAPHVGEPMKAPRNTEQWLAHVKVECPTCDAPALEPCVKVNSHGRRQAIRMVHQARKTASRRLAGRA